MNAIIVQGMEVGRIASGRQVVDRSLGAQAVAMETRCPAREEAFAP